MKEINKESKSKSKQSLKVIVVNPPTKETAKEMIKRISKELSFFIVIFLSLISIGFFLFNNILHIFIESSNI